MIRALLDLVFFNRRCRNCRWHSRVTGRCCRRMEDYRTHPEMTCRFHEWRWFR